MVHINKNKRALTKIKLHLIQWYTHSTITFKNNNITEYTILTTNKPLSPAVNLPFDESLMITESKGWADDKSAYSEISENS